MSRARVGDRLALSMTCRIAISVLVFLGYTAAVRAQPPVSIQHTLRFPDPGSHYIDVDAVMPTGERSVIEVMMAVWTPGSYLVREYARNVEGLMAHTLAGSRLAVENSRKNRWRIDT